MLGLLKRYRELLAIFALLGLPLITYLANAKQGRALNPFDRAVLWVSWPVQKLVNRTAYAIVDTWNDYVALRQVNEENKRLRAELGLLRQELAVLEEAGPENERLRAAVQFAEKAPGPVVFARVIGVGTSSEHLSVTLDRGTRDGVKQGMALATAEGVVGRVQKALYASSYASLLGDTDLRIPIVVQRSRHRATVYGKGERNPCELRNALRTDDIEDGDVAVTSGTDGVFPKGLVVGRIRNVVRPRAGLWQLAQVEPAADVSRLEEVMVLAAPVSAEPLEAGVRGQPTPNQGAR